METDKLHIQLDPAVDNYAVMGNPVTHSKSPQIHLAFARQTDQKLVYQAIYVPAGEFNRAAKMFMEQGGKGLNITLPYKYDAYRFAVNLSDRARTASAVNTLTFSAKGSIDGDNTDGIGLVRDLERNQIQLSGKRLLIIGAGGAVHGVLGPLLEQGPGSVTLANRTLARAEDLVSAHKTVANISAVRLSSLHEQGSFDVIINGTSSSLAGQIPVLPDSIIDSNSSCYDMAYGNSETVFVKWCKTMGARIALDGLGMLVEQAAESFSIWRGIRPETQPVLAMVRDSIPRAHA